MHSDLLPVAALFTLSSLLAANDLSIDGATSVHRSVGTSFVQRVENATPNQVVILAADQSPGPVSVFGLSIPLGFTSEYFIVNIGMTDGAGEYEHTVTIPDDPAFIGLVFYAAAAVVEVVDVTITNGVELNIIADPSGTSTELAGIALAERPFFQRVRNLHESEDVRVAVDTSLLPIAAGRTADIYVVASKTAADWDADMSLVDLSGDGANTFTFDGANVTANSLVVDAGTLAGFDDDRIGVGYDVVIDLDRDGTLSAGDLIDGYGERAGFYVDHDITTPGVHTAVEETYTLGSFLGQNLFYPADIASLGQLPLVVISHGNGHNYQWYDHLGDHLASYGYIEMSHQNNTVPGIQAASTTTLRNTDAFLGNLGTIAGGALAGHVDVSRIVWMGHSRGGEGVARAYDRIIDGSWDPQNYEASDIVLISSIAPTDFLGTNSSTPHGANYHLWVGGSDSDVTGCASSDIVQSFHLLDRAEDQRQSISLHGVGHGDFHNGPGGAFATGPCRVGEAGTHQIMRGYALPLIEYHTYGNPAAKDYLTRQWEAFRPIGAPIVAECVVVDLQFRESAATGKLIIDDFQTNTSTDLASSGATIAFDLPTVRENRMDDANGSFTDFPNGTFNGFTQASANDSSRGALWSADGSSDFSLTYTLASGTTDWSDYVDLSFRSCQVTRHPLTTAELGDTTFEVRVTDADGDSSIVSIGAFGGGIEEPYARTDCGIGTGWANEFETIRIPLDAFREGQPELDLANVATLSFLLGPSHGSAGARLGFDDLELTTD